ncbi:MAG: hypothetical protein U1E38_06435 [Rhodospirillales bacterium]
MVHEVPDLRIIDDALWRQVKAAAGARLWAPGRRAGFGDERPAAAETPAGRAGNLRMLRAATR